MLDILLTIPGKKRQTSSGWYVFNGVCCHHRGHNPDKRARAGIKFQTTDDWSYSCFNCGFKCGTTPGKSYTTNLKKLLQWCGVDEEEIDRLSFQSFMQRGGDRYVQQAEPKKIDFQSVQLPEGFRDLDPKVDSIHINYLRGRGLDPNGYPYKVVDGETRQRLIIPYYWRGMVVGYTSRYYDGKNPKYISNSQSGYVFGIDAQKKDWSICILVEGQFDAISIDGCACGGSNITDEQAQTLKTLNRRVIFVPDRDKAGLSACDRALELGYSVSIPNWGTEIKDTNDAVLKYGKLPTLLSIIKSATSSKVIVELRRKKLL
jgi:hypothetical protein